MDQQEQRHPEIPALERLPSGIRGLDRLLGGGFFRSSLYLVRGEPGSGKTIFANQLCFNHAAEGGTALYVTLLAESHHRMLSHLRELSFFEPSRISRAIHYLNAFPVLEQEGLQGLLTLVRREVLARRASLLVLDGLAQTASAAVEETELRKFFHGLQMQASVIECTMFLFTSAPAVEVRPENTMVDGMIMLCDELIGWVAKRHLTVTKFRGASYLRGRHAFRISNDGITVYPRLEATLQWPDTFGGSEGGRVSTGIAGLDAMLMGGLPEASCTLLMGPTGSGKTVAGLRFLGEATPTSPGLLYGFYETPPNLLRKAANLVPSLAPLVERRTVNISWQSGVERLLDEVGHELLELVAQSGVRRLVVDGIPAFGRLAGSPERLASFFTALSNELRSRNVAALFTLEVPKLVGPVLEAPSNDLSQLADNLIVLRFAEADARTRRLLSIHKVRDSDFDPALREFTISSEGFSIQEGFANHEAVPQSPSPKQRGPGNHAPLKARRDRER